MKFKILVIFFLISIRAFTQESQSASDFKIPTQLSFDIGYRNVFSTIWNGTNSNAYSNKASNGVSIMADYAWKLSGFSGKRMSVYISVPLEYTQLQPDGNVNKQVSVWAYGWTVRHEFANGKLYRPYVGYALLLNRMSVNGIDGEAMGHNTRLEAGINRYGNSNLIPYVKLHYSYTDYTQIDSKFSYHVQSFAVSLGIRY